ncbi:Ethylene-responsive transcription factor CRF1 [Hordeum vulgare]|nr:Ethylene-responsive transcription factor CRF1 [Hordeum vulgare]
MVPRTQLNFSNMWTRKQAQDLAPPPRLITDEDRRVQQNRKHRLLIAEADEAVMAAWRERFPQDVTAENEFLAQRRAERDARRAEKHAWKELAKAQIDNPKAPTWDEDDSRWVDAFTSSDRTTEEDKE